jgi:O-antigen/teichoic acid export membrane protein
MAVRVPARGQDVRRQSPNAQSDQRIGVAKLSFAFITHGLVAAIGVVVVPLYLHFMGAEAYGLVGFYVVAQGWLLLLDAGLAPMLARQLAMATADAQRRDDAARLLKAAEILYVLVALSIAAGFYVSADWIAQSWLGASTLERGDVVASVRILGCLVAVRWLCVLYHAALTGLERQNALNGIILATTILRAGVSVAVVAFVSHGPVAFFAAQAALAVAEAAACRMVLASAIPVDRLRARPDWARLRGEFRFAGALAATSAISVGVSQIDKLALSHFLPLREFGLFSLVVAVSSGLYTVTPPLTQMVSPRLTALQSSGDRPEFVHLYRLSASLMVVIAVSTAGTIAALPGLTLFAWTGTHQGPQLAEVLRLYALGSGCGMWLIIPYLLQYASGSLRLHLIGNVLFGAVWLPASVIAAKLEGALGTGSVWLIGNMTYALLWIPLIYRKLLSSDERSKLGAGWIARVAALSALVSSCVLLPVDALQRGEAFVGLGAIAAVVFGSGILLFPDLRAYAAAAVRDRGGLQRHG